MHAFNKFIGAACLIAAIALPASAGQPGRYYQAPKPVPAPVHPVAPVQYEPVRTHATTNLNIEAERQLVASPPPPPKVVYQQQAPVQPKYNYVRQTAPTYHAPKPTTQHRVCHTPPPTPRPTHKPAGPVCHVPRPAPKPTYHAPKPVYHPPKPAYHAPKPTYHTPKPAYHAPKPGYGHGHGYVKFDPCGHKTITRIENTRKGQRQYIVCFADLGHLPPKKRNAILLDRVEEASKKACRSLRGSIYSARSRRQCREDTTRTAVLKSGLPGLEKAYLRSTGKGRPKVHVGKPVYH